MNALNDWLLAQDIPAEAIEPILFAAGITVIAIFAFLANFIAKRVIIRVLDAVIVRSGVQVLLLLQKHKVFQKLSHIAPAIVIQILAPAFFGEWPLFVEFAQTLVNVYLIGVGILVVDAVLNTFLAGYNQTERSRRLPLKGVVQAAKLIVMIFGIVMIAAVILGKSPLILMSGFGALTAILTLIFKDAILGFVAGIQLSANNMVETGDWIEMPQQGADGFVIDVALTTVKVQNWDKTITMIPSYLLISDSFKNWRGMFESGGRRIKRAIHIDMRTIRFLDAELLERCKKINLLQPYLERVLKEIQQHNSEAKLEVDDLINGRHLTNIGTFRAYCVAYIRQHPRVNQEMTQIARQLAPTEHGLPLELYLFTSDVAWVAHEATQSDIFDHLLAILPHFGLRVFQQPGGDDVAELGKALAAGKPAESSFLVGSGRTTAGN